MIDNEKYEDWEVEAVGGMTEAATSEFTRLKASLRRQAGYDLKWYERLAKGLLGALGVNLRFK